MLLHKTLYKQIQLLDSRRVSPRLICIGVLTTFCRHAERHSSGATCFNPFEESRAEAKAKKNPGERQNERKTPQQKLSGEIADGGRKNAERLLKRKSETAMNHFGRTK